MIMLLSFIKGKLSLEHWSWPEWGCNLQGNLPSGSCHCLGLIAYAEAYLSHKPCNEHVVTSVLNGTIHSVILLTWTTVIDVWCDCRLHNYNEVLYNFGAMIREKWKGKILIPSRSTYIDGASFSFYNQVKGRCHPWASAYSDHISYLSYWKSFETHG